jgi:hypothetical protein
MLGKNLLIATLALVVFAPTRGWAWPQEFINLGAESGRRNPQGTANAMRDVFGLNPEFARGRWAKNGVVQVQLVQSSAPACVVWPEEKPSFTFQFTNLTDKPLPAKGRVRVVQYEVITNAPGDDPFDIGMKKVAEAGEIPISVDLPAKGWQDVTVAPPIPETFGGYTLIVELEGQDSLFGATLVRTFKPDPAPQQFYRLTIDSHEPEVLTRLGVTVNRIGVPYKATTDPDYEKVYAEISEKLKALRDNNLPVCIEFGGGALTHPNQPLGIRRQMLDGNDLMKPGGGDIAWLPSSDADFKKFVSRFATEWGWPKGPINAMKLWNEPWNGGSISGWGADDERYREIYTTMCEAVEAARADAGVQILLGGCDSSANTMDKLFADGSDKFSSRLDFLSIHYQGTNPYTTYKPFVDRKPNRVQVWDTESWVANSDDRVASTLASMLSFGQDRVVGIYSDNVVVAIQNRDVRLASGTTEKRKILQTWSVGAAIGAFQHFVGERPFTELLFKNGMPFVMQFEDAKNVEDATVVVVGDLGATYGPDRVAFRTCRSLAEGKAKEELRAKLAALPAESEERGKLVEQIATPTPYANCSMTLPADPRYSLYDFYGNPVAAVDGKIVIPLDARGFYLRGDGKPGSHAALVEALKSGRIDGLSPVAVRARDMLAPISQQPALSVELTNVLNRPIKGTVSFTVDGLKLESPAPVELSANETMTIEARVVEGSPREDNRYPLRLVADFGDDGRVVHEEEMRVNWIAKRTMTVDGKLDDWQDTIPQPVVFSGKQTATMMEKAWRPYDKFDESVKKGFAVGYLSYDQKNLYFAARVSDSTPHPGLPRFTDHGHWDEYFYPEVAYKEDPVKTTARREVDSKSGIPSSKQWEPTSERMELDLDLPGERMVSLALFDRDGLERRTSRYVAKDLLGGKKLAETTAKEASKGVWTRLRLSGKVRIVIDSPMWLKANLAAVAVDPVPANAPTGAVLPEDRTTGGKFNGAYGSELLLLPGEPARGSVTARWNDVAVNTELRWPEEVRRYSYRSSPVLPFTGDGIQIAFNVLPDAEKPRYPAPPGTFKGYIDYDTTDYEFALNTVAERFGGGTEVWRLQYPGMPYKHFYPRQPASPLDGPARGAQLITTRQASQRISECAIPWEEIPQVKAALDAGKTIKFTFRINDDAGVGCMELARNRSVSRRNASAFHPDWSEHWGNELEFGFEK